MQDLRMITSIVARSEFVPMEEQTFPVLHIRLVGENLDNNTFVGVGINPDFLVVRNFANGAWRRISVKDPVAKRATKSNRGRCHPMLCVYAP